jgi:hypothetical protein
MDFEFTDELLNELAEFIESPDGLKCASTILISLCDDEFKTTNEALLKAVANLLKSEDKILAQHAAIFLYMSGGKLGETLLNDKINNEELPHIVYVKGIIPLLS